MENRSPYDVIIIGGGPAGLSAALVLGRCRRDVLILDSNHGRNKRANEIHGYLTRDRIQPADFLELGRAEVLKYGVTISSGEAHDAHVLPEGLFSISWRLNEESPTETVFSKKLLMATGMRDVLPTIEGLIDFYGVSVHHCPYCDGWEHREQRIVAYGKGDAAIGLALALHTWSGRVIACTDGVKPSADFRTRAALMDIEVCDEPISRLEGKAPYLERVRFANGDALDCEALFFNTGQVQRSNLPRRLGCRFKEDGGVVTSDRQCTGVRGMYVAGDADREVQFVIVAAAEGATAAVAINRELQDDALFARSRGE